jgi:hypothetical protein
VRRPPTLVHAAHATVVVVALSLLACGERARTPDSARTATDSSARAPSAPSSSLAATPGAATFPGQLTKPIEQYTGDEFYQFVQQLKWGGGVEKDRKCKGNPSCDGTKPSQHTVVRVDAVDGQDSISATRVPSNGVVAVRAINRGALDEERYGFKANRKLEYYMIVLPGTGANGRWQFEELDTTPGARRHSSAGTGTFKPCNHPFRPGRVNRVNFYTCDESRLADSVQKSNLLMFAAPNPVWVDCSDGCCIAD